MLASTDERYRLTDEADELGLWDVMWAEEEWTLRLSDVAGVSWMNAAERLVVSGKLEAGRAGDCTREILWLTWEAARRLPRRRSTIR